jgi:uncharacterized RDD family membrane protein YckC
LGTRFVAYLIDSVVVSLLATLPIVLIWYTNLSPTIIAAVASVLMLAWALLVWWMFAVRGAGPGMRVMHLQLVGLANGRPIGWGRFLLRQLILFGLALTGIGLLLMVVFLAQHPRRQGWHDLAVNSVVIKERQLARPQPPAQPRHAAVPGAAGPAMEGQQGQAPGTPMTPGSSSPSSLAPPAGYSSVAGGPAGYPSPQAAPAGYPYPQGSPDRGTPAAATQPVGSPPPYEPVSRVAPGRPSGPATQPVQLAGYGTNQSPGAPPQALQPPSGSRPGTGQPGSGQPGSGQPGAGQPGSGQPGAGQPGAGQPVAGQPDAGQPGAGQLAGTVSAIGSGAGSAWPEPPRSASASWRAVLDDGREIVVDGLVLLGRNPQARPGEEHATLIKVADTTRTVSKSHLEINLDSHGLHVVDRGSTNGSTVTSVSGVSRRCAPGEPIQVEPGSIVSFGDHWLEVRRD